MHTLFICLLVCGLADQKCMVLHQAYFMMNLFVVSVVVFSINHASAVLANVYERFAARLFSKTNS